MKTLIINSHSPKELFAREDTQFVVDGYLGPVATTITFDTMGVTCEVLGASIVNATASHKYVINLNHVVPNTSCNMLIKNVLQDKAQVEFIGKIVIAPAANNTSSFLYDHALVVGNETSNISQPELQIDANDVKASHGATTTKINKEHMYYLQSRGLSEQEAREIIISGFLHQVIDRIKDSKIRESALKRVKLKHV